MTRVSNAVTWLPIAKPPVGPPGVESGIWARSARLCLAIALATAVMTLVPLRAAAQCLNDSDCDDGLFCTTDHCIFFVCARFDRSCDDFNACTSDSCNETANRCDYDTPCLTRCDDFDFFTLQERCNGAGECVGLPSSPIVAAPVRCCVSTDCPFNQLCVETLCVLDPSPRPTPPPTTTPRQRTPFSTRTPTPDNRPGLGISDVVGNEGNSGSRNFVFTLTLSSTINQQVTVSLLTADGSAAAGSDYGAAGGTVTIPANALTAQLPGILVNGDTALEADETFLVRLTNVSNNVRVADSTGQGVIVNDEELPFGIGIAALVPRDSVVRVDEPTPVILTWTHPQRWRALNTLDLRLRGDRGIAIWLRFDEAANTVTLINPANVSPGPTFPLGSAEELGSDTVAVILADSIAQARDPEAPTVDLTLTLRFTPAAASQMYLVDAAATDDTGEVQDFDTVGSIGVAPLLSCQGDCNHDGLVSVDELVRGVNIVLETGGLDACPDFDANASGSVEIDEVVAAVARSLGGCATANP